MRCELWGKFCESFFLVAACRCGVELAVELVGGDVRMMKQGVKNDSDHRCEMCRVDSHVKGVTELGVGE